MGGYLSFLWFSRPSIQSPGPEVQPPEQGSQTSPDTESIAPGPQRVKAPKSKRVRCPYSPDDAEHYTAEHKLMWHILKCEDYKTRAHLFNVCPYDALHVLKKTEDMEAHISAVHSADLDRIDRVKEYYEQKPEENPWAQDWPEDVKSENQKPSTS